MTTSELLVRVLDLTEQAVAIRKTITLDLPRHIFTALNDASLDLITEAEKVADELEELSKEDNWRTDLANKSIDKALNVKVKSTWNS